MIIHILHSHDPWLRSEVRLLCGTQYTRTIGLDFEYTYVSVKGHKPVWVRGLSNCDSCILLSLENEKDVYHTEIAMILKGWKDGYDTHR